MPRRVLLFNTDLEVGGTPGVIRELARRLPDGTFEVDVACLGRYGPVADQIAADGGRVTAFDVRPWQLPAAVRRLCRLVSERRIDVVLSFLVHANAVAALASGRFPRVHWMQSIQTTQQRPRWHWAVQRLASRRAEAFVVPSDSIREVAMQRCGIEPGRMHVIPNAVDANSMAAAPRKREAGAPFRVGFLGRLDPIKNLDMLILAIAKSRRVELHIYGDGPERRRLERLSGRHVKARDRSRVTFHGLTDRDKALAGMDVLVLPSRAEGHPMVLLEAMAAGIPVIGTDVPGIRGVIDHGTTGLLIRSQPDELAAALIRLRDDVDLAVSLAGAGLEKVRSRWTWDRVIPQYRSLLKTAPD